MGVDAARDPAGEAGFPAELLDGLDGPAREARERLLSALRERGVDDDELLAAGREGRLALLPAERLISGDARYTAAQMAERSGLDPDFLATLRRAQGLPVPDPDAAAYTEVELELGRLAARFREAGFSPESMLQITRTLGRGLSQAAAAMRAATLEVALEPGADEYELALRFAEMAERVEPLLTPMLGHMLRLHMREVVRGQLALAAADEGGLESAQEIAVAFADLVGFTRMGEEVAPDELGRIAGRLEVLAAQCTEPPVRLVKSIGDAVMLVSPDPRALLDAGLDLVEAADAEGEDFPQLRVGIACGPALERAGDWYGAPVNLASRVTDVARPGSVLVTQDVVDHVDAGGLRFSFARERRLKGIRQPVRLHRARRGDEK